jgi:cyclin-dependent kinase/cell division cycle 2-like protein
LDAFKRLKQIGEGAFGTVTKARDRCTGEVVAIKSARDGSSEAAAALLREAALLAACAGNPAVVALRKVARSESGGLHLVMEYVGPSLHDIISARRRHDLRFTESEARRVMAQLLVGVGSMHAHGIVHRDLKPGNVLVREHDRRLKICDLGLARSAAAPPLDAQLEGTLGYIAPEALLCQKDCAGPVDIWAFGCIMAELVGGEKLFQEDDEYTQLVSIVDLLGIPDQVSLIPLGVSAPKPSKLREKVPARSGCRRRVLTSCVACWNTTPRTGSPPWRRCRCHGLKEGRLTTDSAPATTAGAVSKAAVLLC